MPTPAEAGVVATSGFVTATSDDGDIPGRGRSAQWMAAEISAQGDGSYLDISAYSSTVAVFHFSAPTGQILGVGTYAAISQPDADHAGITLHYQGETCPQDNGSFTIRDVGYDVDTGEVDRLDMTWLHHCGSADAATYGQIVINEPQADPSVLVMPSAPVTFPPVYPGLHTAVARVRVVNTGTTALHPAFTLAGADAGLFEIRSDLCTGTTLGIGLACTLGVRFDAPSSLDHDALATLVEQDDSSAGTHTLDFAGSVITAHTSWDLAGDPDDRVVGPIAYQFAPGPTATMSASGDATHVDLGVTSTTLGRVAAKFGAPEGGVLAPGTYAVNPADSASATFSFAGGYRCPSGSPPAGSFTLHEYTLNPTTGYPAAISVTFQMACSDGRAGAGYGTIVYHGTDPAQPRSGPGSASDTTPPTAVGGFHVSATPRGGTLTWKNPRVADLGNVVVRRAAGLTPPATPSSGTAVYTGAGTASHVRHLTPGVSYAFSIWAIDTRGNISPPRHVVLHGTFLTIAAPRPAPYGLSFVIAVGVADVDTGAPLRYVQVRFLKRRTPTSPWTVFTAADTNGKGIATKSFVIRRQLALRVLFVGRGPHSRISRSRTITVGPGLTGGYYAPVPVGGTEVVHGTIRPNLAGHRIYLLKIARIQLRDETLAVLTSDSRFRWAFTISHNGKVRFRIYLPKRPGLVALDSRFTVVVG